MFDWMLPEKHAIAILKKDHDTVKELFEKFENTDSSAEKEKIIAKAVKELKVHAAIEEKHFYPATRSARTEDLLQEAVEEHLSVKRIIADLLEMDPAEAQFDAKIKVLQEQVEHHVEEEEEDLFPKARKLLSEDELDDLGVVMEDMAHDLEAGGSPRDAVPGETDEAAPL